MTLDQLKAEAAMIQEMIEAILADIKPADFGGQAVNWADLHCVDVGLSLTGDPMWTATIEEASPDATGLASYVSAELQRQRYDVWVRTEW